MTDNAELETLEAPDNAIVLEWSGNHFDSYPLCNTNLVPDAQRHEEMMFFIAERGAHYRSQAAAQARQARRRRTRWD